MESTEGKRNAQIISDYCLENQLGLPTHSETSVVAIVSQNQQDLMINYRIDVEEQSRRPSTKPLD